MRGRLDSPGGRGGSHSSSSSSGGGGDTGECRSSDPVLAGARNGQGLITELKHLLTSIGSGRTLSTVLNFSLRCLEEFIYHPMETACRTCGFEYKEVCPPFALIKAKVPWLARRGNLSEKDRVLKKVKGILNKLTLEKFDLLKGQLLDTRITTADTLKDVTSLIFRKAVVEPTFCPMYAQLCYEVREYHPSFPAEEPEGGSITFKRLLLNNCQEVFECADSLRVEIARLSGSDQVMERGDEEIIFKLITLGNIRLIGELMKTRMAPEKIGHHIIKTLLGCDKKAYPDKEHVEAICEFFNTVGKHLDENPSSCRMNDTYFIQIKELVANPQLTPRSKFMLLDLIALRSNNWAPQQREVNRIKLRGLENMNG